MTRALVCGGRGFKDVEKLYAVLDNWKPAISVIIHGGARGADSLAGQWAAEHQVDCECYPADWATWGRSAGPRRNQLMLVSGRPDVVLAFPTDKSVGTWDMVERAHRAKVAVTVFGFADKSFQPRVRWSR
jgi:hypothetical protein